eukprot:SM000053S17436  [mRNA]  locus=s53:289053:290080:- [translate_table: standard]
MRCSQELQRAAMAKKRKSEAARLDEAERTLYSSFCAAANSVSQLYTQAQAQQRVAFQAGQRSALERVHQWALREQPGTAHVAREHLFAFLQREFEQEAAPLPSAPPLAHQLAAATAAAALPPYPYQLHLQHPLPAAAAPPPRLGGGGSGNGGNVSDQGKGSMFAAAAAVSSPTRRSALAAYAPAQHQVPRAEDPPAVERRLVQEPGSFDDRQRQQEQRLQRRLLAATEQGVAAYTDITAAPAADDDLSMDMHSDGSAGDTVHR